MGEDIWIKASCRSTIKCTLMLLIVSVLIYMYGVSTHNSNYVLIRLYTHVWQWETGMFEHLSIQECLVF